MGSSLQQDLYARERREMVDRQLKARGLENEAVLRAMAEVPRHLFVDEQLRPRAYEDSPLPIGEGQTISQPYMVARMTDLCGIRPEDRVLEVGAGSGYQTAILAKLCQHVYAAEIVPALAEGARAVLASLGIDNVTYEVRDGSRGWPEHAPYDAILVAAGAPSVPDALRQQLAQGGRLVIPVGRRDVQVLQKITRDNDTFTVSEDTPCRFVDLRGESGWDGSALN